MSRAYLATLLLGLPLLRYEARAQGTRPAANPQGQSQEAEPPEEDESFKKRTYDFNPLKASKSIEIGNEYFKKGNYAAAKGRYMDATLYDPGSAQAFEKLGEVEEKLHDLTAARQAYAKCLELSPTGKDAEAVKKRMEKLPAPRASSEPGK